MKRWKALEKTFSLMWNDVTGMIQGEMEDWKKVTEAAVTYAKLVHLPPWPFGKQGCSAREIVLGALAATAIQRVGYVPASLGMSLHKNGDRSSKLVLHCSVA